MTPATLRRRIEILRERQLERAPAEPTPVLIAAEGETVERARARAGVPPGAFAVVIVPQDMSIPRD